MKHDKTLSLTLLIGMVVGIALLVIIRVVTLISWGSLFVLLTFIGALGVHPIIEAYTQQSREKLPEFIVNYIIKYSIQKEDNKIC